MQIWALNDGFEYKEWCLLSASMKIFQTLSSLAKFVWLDTITCILIFGKIRLLDTIFFKN